MSRKPNKPAAPAFESGVIAVLIPMTTVVLASLFYTAGWSFAYHYFDRFDLGLIGLDIQREYFFLYGFWTFKQKFWAFLLGFIALALVWGSVWFYLQKKRAAKDGLAAVRGVLTLILLLSFMACLFPVFYHSGKIAGQNAHAAQARIQKPFVFPSYPGVQVWMTRDGKENMEPLAGEWESGCYRLLLSHRDKLYLFNPTGIGGEIPDKIPVDVIPMSRVRAYRVLPAPTRCGD